MLRSLLGRRRLLRMAAAAVLVLLAVSVAGTALARSPAVVVPDPTPPSPRADYRETMLGRLLGGMLLAMSRGLMTIIEGLQATNIQELVFDPPADWVHGTFTPDEWAHVLRWHGVLRAISLSAMVLWLGAMVIGFKVLATSFAPERRAGLGLMATKVLLVLIVALSGPLLAGLFLELNQALTGAIRSALEAQGILQGLDQVGRADFIDTIRTGSSIIDGLVSLMYVGVTVVFNLLYFIRRMMLALTVIVLPLVAWAFVSTRTALAAMTVLSELWSNALMPFTHAIALALYLAFVRLDDPRWWVPIVGLYLVILMANFLRRLMTGLLEWFGVGEERFAGAAAAGLGGLMAIGTLIPALAGAHARQLGAIPPRRLPEAGAAAGAAGTFAGGGTGGATLAFAGMPPIGGGPGAGRPGAGGGAYPSSGGFVQTPFVTPWNLNDNQMTLTGGPPGGGAPPSSGGYTASASGLLVPASASGSAPSSRGAGPAGSGRGSGGPGRPPREETQQRVWRDAGRQTGWDRFRVASSTSAGLLGTVVGMGFDAAGLPGLGATPLREHFTGGAGAVTDTAEGFYWWIHNRRNPIPAVDCEGRATAPARPGQGQAAAANRARVM